MNFGFRGEDPGGLFKVLFAGLARVGGAGQFNIISLITGSFGFRVGFAGLFYKACYVTLSLGSGFFGASFCFAGRVGILQKA